MQGWPSARAAQGRRAQRLRGPLASQLRHARACMLHAAPGPPPPCLLPPQTAATKSVTLEVALGMLAFPKVLGLNPATGWRRMACAAVPADSAVGLPVLCSDPALGACFTWLGPPVPGVPSTTSRPHARPGASTALQARPSSSPTASLGPSCAVAPCPDPSQRQVLRRAGLAGPAV